ncbi:hypothetical protein NONI108955_36125 [Nocardia ninae]|uniref:Uncharacterized protein n=1 Tax=Nocardia ninae NBRC 108245 TaxID=1210091 RepID=A0A511MM38_9NOCA|nr:hypothetical protein NN4_60500 [Nocardia ninae NBRC 108245]
MPEWWADPEMVTQVSAAVVEVLARPDTQSVGLCASLVWFEPELSAVNWPSHGKAA